MFNLFEELADHFPRQLHHFISVVAPCYGWAFSWPLHLVLPIHPLNSRSLSQRISGYILVPSSHSPSYLGKLSPSKEQEKRMTMKSGPTAHQALYFILSVFGSCVTRNVTVRCLHLINQETEWPVLVWLPWAASQPRKRMVLKLCTTESSGSSGA